MDAPPFKRLIDEHWQRTQERVLELLMAEQKRHWQELIGAPFPTEDCCPPP